MWKEMLTHCKLTFSQLTFIASSLILSSRLYATSSALRNLPKIITSREFLKHKSIMQHPECPERIELTLPVLQSLEQKELISIEEPPAIQDEKRFYQALAMIESVHDKKYVHMVQTACKRGQRILSPWDEDTYIDKDTFIVTVYAQSAWLQAVDTILSTTTSSSINHNSTPSEHNIAFAITRPPGHHASHDEAMGFCLFNFAAVAAHYALQQYSATCHRVAILDFDVHYGNGVADLIKSNPQIVYASLHQADIFPYGRGKRDEQGDHHNIYNVPLPYGTTGNFYIQQLEQEVLPFLLKFQPDLLIACAGYDALSSDELAQVSSLLSTITLYTLRMMCSFFISYP
jgi:acetoin utilization deacetylase AcuC-like enzyme